MHAKKTTPALTARTWSPSRLPYPWVLLWGSEHCARPNPTPRPTTPSTHQPQRPSRSFLGSFLRAPSPDLTPRGSRLPGRSATPRNPRPPCTPAEPGPRTFPTAAPPLPPAPRPQAPGPLPNMATGTRARRRVGRLRARAVLGPSCTTARRHLRAPGPGGASSPRSQPGRARDAQQAHPLRGQRRRRLT